MEARLRPLNGLLGLCVVGDLNPATLADAGFRLIALEVPVGVEEGRVVVDAVVLHEPSALLLACECKSGANVEEAQARKYAALDPVALAQAASFDLRGGRPSVEPMYVCLAEHASRIQQGLRATGVSAALLTVSPDRLDLVDSDRAPRALVDAWPERGVKLTAGVPRIIPCDAESPSDVLKPQIHAVLVSHLTQRTSHVASVVIANETLRNLPIYGAAARHRFERNVDICLRAIAHDHPNTYRFEPSTAAREAVVRFLRTPEDNDNRGRTQAYQAQARPRHTGRKPATQDPDQLDLLDELAAGTEDADEPDDSEGGSS